jgi:hypothetical protein
MAAAGTRGFTGLPEDAQRFAHLLFVPQALEIGGLHQLLPVAPHQVARRQIVVGPQPGVLQLQQQGAFAGIVHGDAAVGHQQEQGLQEPAAGAGGAAGEGGIEGGEDPGTIQGGDRRLQVGPVLNANPGVKTGRWARLGDCRAAG